MWYNKKKYSMYIVLCCILLFAFAQWQADFGFGGSIPRTDSSMVSGPVSDGWTTRMAIDSFALHLDYHGIIIEREIGLLALIQELQLSITIDVVSLLDQAVDKKETLYIYIWSMDQLLQNAIWQLDSTSLRLTGLFDLMRRCLTDKDIADRAFFAAVNANDDSAARRALDDSLRASTCATEYRVQLNALQAQYDKLEFYVRVLQRKYDYIITKEGSIIQYFFVLKSDLLRDLTAIAAELQAFRLTR
jgi:hypothetical protein